MTTITIGSPVPNFSANSTPNGIFTLAEHQSHSNIVLYFYPKDNTAGCTTQGQNFSALYADFKALDTLIVGVSRDSLKTHENFRQKYQFPFELITDQDEQICRLFDVMKLKNLYGKTYMGIERSTFLIDKKGILQQVWRKVKVANHAQAVLAATRQLQ